MKFAKRGSTALALKVKKDTWFFIPADYAFGHSLERMRSAS
jgi:hypothetical protein